MSNTRRPRRNSEHDPWRYRITEDGLAAVQAYQDGDETALADLDPYAREVLMALAWDLILDQSDPTPATLEARA